MNTAASHYALFVPSPFPLRWPGDRVRFLWSVGPVTSWRSPYARDFSQNVYWRRLGGHRRRGNVRVPDSRGPGRARPAVPPSETEAARRYPGREARCRAHAGEPQLRPLLRQPQGRSRLRRPIHDHAARRPVGVSAADHGPGCSGHDDPVPLAPERRTRVGVPGRPPTTEFGDRRAGVRRYRAQLGRPARGLVRRPDERLGVRQGRPDDPGLFEPPRHPVPLRARRQLHGRRRVPLLGAVGDRAEPHLSVERNDRRAAEVQQLHRLQRR